MKILKFKTNIHCEDCVKKVTPYLDKEESISRWKVDTESEDNILSVSGEELNPHVVKSLVEEAGFTAETVRVLGAGGGDI